MNKKRSRAEYAYIRRNEAKNKEYYKRDDGRALPPHTICISVNNNCFMRCKMCDIGNMNSRPQTGRTHPGDGDKRMFAANYSGGSKYREFPKERVLALIDEVSPFNPTLKTNFIEPLMYKDLEEIVRYAKKRSLRFYTITNGWMLEENIDWMVDARLDLIRISLDGVENIHDEIRGVNGSYRRVINGTRKLIELKRRTRSEKPIIGLCYTISNHNYHNLYDFMKNLEALDMIEHVYINFNHLFFTTQWEVDATKLENERITDIRPSSIDHVSVVQVDTTVLKREIGRVEDEFGRNNLHYYFSPWLKPKDLESYYDAGEWMFPRSKCYLPWQTAQLDIEGNVGIFGHCILPAFGNIMDQSFSEVWNSPAARETRKHLKEAGSYPGCNKCIGTMYPLRGRD